jgi:hypothetical protein
MLQTCTRDVNRLYISYYYAAEAYHQYTHQTACLQRGKSEVVSHCELPAPVQLRVEQGADPIWAEAWRWRENLQRAIDGCHTTDEMSSAGLAAYSELKGPNMPLSCGYTVRH